ncbi:hypothetical protein OAO63_00180 [Nitrosopumilus sp.]|nr:hypothetical protein [Nitrosopumilus sp.]
MTVSSSKFTFSLIAVAALMITGAGVLTQESFAAVPTFTAVHNSSTTTEITFSEGTNGTLVLANWKVNGAAPTAITNGTATGAAFKAAHYGGSAVGVLNMTTTAVGGSTIIPGANVIMLTHASLDTADNGTAASTMVYYISGNLGAGKVKTATVEQVADGTKYLAADHTLPYAVSANTKGPTLIEVHMSEKVMNLNATASAFNIVGVSEAITKIIAVNGTGANSGTSVDVPAIITGGTKVINIFTANPITVTNDNLTLTYTASATQFITDDTNSTVTVGSDAASGNGGYSNAFAGAQRGFAEDRGVGTNSIGHGNILQTFSGLAISNYINALSEETCYDCSAPQINTVQVRTGSTNPIEATDANPANLVAEVGDKISFNIGFTDNRGAGDIPYTGIYTNFVDSADFDNLYYMNNFDSFNKMSTTYYEWNARNTDVAYDLSNAATWDETLTKIEVNGYSEIFFIEYTMTATDAIPSSQVWVEVADYSGNYIKIQLPVTIEVTGDEDLTFGSDGQQKVLGFFNESVLTTIVSSWTDSSNSAQLSNALGIPDESLPTWTSELATWVVDDSIDAADMIVAIEYLIN